MFLVAASTAAVLARRGAVLAVLAGLAVTVVA